MSYLADIVGLLLPYQQVPDVPRDLRVSRSSLWGDAVWRFPATTAGAKDAALRWDFLVDETRRLTDSNFEDLLEQARRVIWSIRVASQRGRNPKDRTLADMSWAFRSLIRWMVANGIRHFSQLVPDTCSAYLADVAERLGRRGMLTQNMIGAYADTLCRIHEQGVLFREVPDAVIAAHPFGGKTATDVALDYAPRVRPGFIPAVPDPIYLASMAAAFEWMDVRAGDVLDLQQILLDARSKVCRYRSNSYNYLLNRALSKFRFVGGGAGEAWRPPLSENNALSEARSLHNDGRDAGVLALQGLLGLRISEVCGIPAGDLPEGAAWPTCVSVTPSISGMNELFHLHGRVYKQRDVYEEVTWLAGSRPAGSDYVPPAVRAVTFLWKLMRPWREMGGRKELVVSLGAFSGFPWEGRFVARALSQTLGKCQKSWVEEHVDVPREYLGWNLTTHQWRKSFAIYMVRSDPRLLPAVRDHFKHMSVAMTERGYLGQDVEMLGMLDDEATYAAAQFLFDAVNGRPAAGKMMDTVEQNAATIRELIGAEGTEQDKVERLAMTLKDDDIRVWPSDWGNCFFRSELARCHFLSKGKFDLIARRPHYGQRRPGVCCDCANLLIFSGDAAFWEARYKSGLVVLEANRVAGEHAAAAVAEDRVRSSAAILRRLGIPVAFPMDDAVMEEADEFS